MIEKITLNTNVGAYSVQIPFFLLGAIPNTAVLVVAREGEFFDIVNTVPGNRQVRYNQILRRLSFNTPFFEDETVTVLIKNV